MGDAGVPSVVKLAEAKEVLSTHNRESLTLEDRLRRQLLISSYTALHDIECDCQEGAVTLRGGDIAISCGWEVLSGGGYLGFDSIDELNSGDHFGHELRTV